jgi:hypothetical protein
MESFHLFKSFPEHFPHPPPLPPPSSLTFCNSIRTIFFRILFSSFIAQYKILCGEFYNSIIIR